MDDGSSLFSLAITSNQLRIDPTDLVSQKKRDLSKSRLFPVDGVGAKHRAIERDR